MKRIIVGITGASGSCYAKKLIEYLLKSGIEVHLVITNAGREVANYELGWSLSGNPKQDQQYLDDLFQTTAIHLYDEAHIGASIASGSVRMDGMVVIPASMGTVSGIATGRSINLLERSADVILKEKRNLIMVPRETPFSEIHLNNLLTLARMGVDIIPAMPAFYNHPESIDDLVDNLVGRVLDHLGVEQDVYRRWEG
ncbi:UbiX family flavin prenyltransferase [Clostridia bacterium]|nr:UbiX family flavin prenyltransferase [Clostridia bacterium]